MSPANNSYSPSLKYESLDYPWDLKVPLMYKLLKKVLKTGYYWKAFVEKNPLNDADCPHGSELAFLKKCVWRIIEFCEHLLAISLPAALPIPRSLKPLVFGEHAYLIYTSSQKNNPAWILSYAGSPGSLSMLSSSLCKAEHLTVCYFGWLVSANGTQPKSVHEHTHTVWLH